VNGTISYSLAISTIFAPFVPQLQEFHPEIHNIAICGSILSEYPKGKGPQPFTSTLTA
jgi:hypothetical protein